MYSFLHAVKCSQFAQGEIVALQMGLRLAKLCAPLGVHLHL